MNKIILIAVVQVSLLTAISFGASAPVVTLHSPGAQTVNVGTNITVNGTASDADGDLAEHWLEVRNPSGSWSWEGWLTSEPFGPALNGSTYSSNKSGNVVLSSPGVYSFRVTATDNFHPWSISNEVQVTVVAPQGHINIQASLTLTHGSAPNATGAHYSINDNGTVSGATTYTQHIGGPQNTIGVYNGTAGPGYVAWVERYRYGHSDASLITNQHVLKIARYIRSTRSWTVTSVTWYGANNNGGTSGSNYNFCEILPTVLHADTLYYTIVKQQWAYPYTVTETNHTFTVPTQQL